MKEKLRFYQAGLHFECTRCGNCCHFPGGKVYLSKNRVQEISRYLNLLPEDLTQKYCKPERTKYVLKDGNGSGCCFLENDQCQIYPVRPFQCQTFPFWPENLKSQYRWKQLTSFCPGIGKGELYGAERIRQIEKIQKNDED